MPNGRANSSYEAKRRAYAQKFVRRAAQLLHGVHKAQEHADDSDDDNEEAEGAKQQSPAKKPDGSIKCVICLDKIRKDLCVLGGCEHFYHADCVSRWSRRQNTCPTCRAEFACYQIVRDVPHFMKTGEVVKVTLPPASPAAAEQPPRKRRRISRSTFEFDSDEEPEDWPEGTPRRQRRQQRQQQQTSAKEDSAKSKKRPRLRLRKRQTGAAAVPSLSKSQRQQLQRKQVDAATRDLVLVRLGGDEERRFVPPFVRDFREAWQHGRVGHLHFAVPFYPRHQEVRGPAAMHMADRRQQHREALERQANIMHRDLREQVARLMARRDEARRRREAMVQRQHAIERLRHEDALRRVLEESRRDHRLRQQHLGIAFLPSNNIAVESLHCTRTCVADEPEEIVDLTTEGEQSSSSAVVDLSEGDDTDEIIDLT
ncbi:MAG: hypothetical protein MHM6MM_003187 [Cercozoa sp. M6MM]